MVCLMALEYFAVFVTNMVAMKFFPVIDFILPYYLVSLSVRVRARAPSNDFHWSITGTRRSVHKQTQEKRKQKNQ